MIETIYRTPDGQEFLTEELARAHWETCGEQVLKDKLTTLANECVLPDNHDDYDTGYHFDLDDFVTALNQPDNKELKETLLKMLGFTETVNLKKLAGLSEPERFCRTCRHIDLPEGRPPCDLCMRLHSHPNWEPAE